MVPLAVSPLLTRLFDPADFGIFSLYFSILMVASVFATFKYEMAIVLPSDDREARTVFELSVALSFISATLLFTSLLIFKDEILSAVNGEALGYQLLLTAPGLLAVGLAQSYYYYLNRQQNYRLMSGVRIVRSLVYSVFAVVGGLFKISWTLIGSDVLGHIVSVIFAGRLASTKKVKRSSFHELRRAAVKYITFPKFLIISGVLEKAAGQLPVFLLINLFHSLPAAGLFAFAQRIIVAPADLVSRAVGDVFRQKASQEFHQGGQCTVLFLSTFKNLTLIGIIPFTVAFFIAEDLFELLFGSEWREAGTFARILMPLFFLQFVVSPLSSMFIIANKQRFDLVIQILLFTCATLSFVLGKALGNDSHLSIMLYSATYCFKYVIEFLLAYKFSTGKK